MGGIISQIDEKRKWGRVHALEQSGTGAKAWVGVARVHMGWGMRGSYSSGQDVRAQVR